MGGPSREGLDRVLLSPKRFMIATILYLRGPTTMADLQRILEISWGDLDSNVRRLREEGYIEARKVITMSGPRTLVKLTRKGYERYESLLEALEGVIESVRRGRRQARLKT